MGCADERMVATGPLDPLARTVVVALSQGTRLQVFAAPSEEALELPLDDFSASEALVIHRVQLRETMSELGFSTQRVPSAPAPNRPLRSVPHLAVEAATLEPGDTSSFELGELSPAVGAFLVPDPHSCPNFRFEEVEEHVEYSLGTLELPDGRSILYGRLGYFVLEAPERASFVASPLGILYGAAADPGGQLWLIGETELARVDVETGARLEVAPVPRDPFMPGALLVIESAPLWVRTLTHRAEIYELRDGAWSLHRALPREFVGRESIDRMIIRSRGGDAFLAGAQYLSNLVEFDARGYRFFRSGGISRGFPGIGRTRDGRYFLADSYSAEFYVEAGEGWRRGHDLFARIFSYATFGEELYLYTSNEGFLGVFDLERGPICPPTPLGYFSGLRDVVRVGERHFVAGELNGPRTVAGWLITE